MTNTTIVDIRQNRPEPVSIGQAGYLMHRRMLDQTSYSFDQAARLVEDAISGDPWSADQLAERFGLSVYKDGVQVADCHAEPTD